MKPTISYFADALMSFGLLGEIYSVAFASFWVAVLLVVLFSTMFIVGLEMAIEDVIYKDKLKTAQQAVVDAQGALDEAQKAVDVAKQNSEEVNLKAIEAMKEINTKIRDGEKKLNEEMAIDAENFYKQNPNLKWNPTDKQAKAIKVINETKKLFGIK